MRGELAEGLREGGFCTKNIHHSQAGVWERGESIWQKLKICTLLESISGGRNGLWEPSFRVEGRLILKKMLAETVERIKILIWKGSF